MQLEVVSPELQRPVSPIFNRTQELLKEAIVNYEPELQFSALYNLNSALAVEEARRGGKIDERSYQLLKFLRTTHANNMGFPSAFFDEPQERWGGKPFPIAFDKVAQFYYCGSGRPLAYTGINQEDIPHAIADIRSFVELTKDIDPAFFQISKEEVKSLPQEINARWTGGDTFSKLTPHPDDVPNGKAQMPSTWVTSDDSRAERLAEIWIRGLRARSLYQLLTTQVQHDPDSHGYILLDTNQKEFLNNLSVNPIFSNTLYDEFYQRNKDLIREFEEAEMARDMGEKGAGDKDRWREFLVGLELDLELRAVALDNRRDPGRAQAEFLLAQLEDPTSLELSEAKREAEKLHHARLLSVYPDRIGDFEEKTAVEKEYIDRNTRTCYGDRMTQGRGNARGSIETPQALKAYVAELKEYRRKIDAIGGETINPEEQGLDKGFEALRKDTSEGSLLNTLIQASYDLSDEVISEAEILAARQRLKGMLATPEAKAADVIHKGFLAGSALNVVVGRIETDGRRKIGTEVTKEMVRSERDMKDVLEDPLYSPEAAYGEYQSLGKLETVRNIHLLQRLIELSKSGATRNIIVREIHQLDEQAKSQASFIEALHDTARTSVEKLLTPALRRGKRVLQTEERVKGAFDESGHKRSLRYRLRKEFAQLDEFLATRGGKRFLSQLNNDDFLLDIVTRAQHGDKSLSGRKEEVGGKTRIVYDTPQGKFYQQTKRWLPVILVYRGIKDELYKLKEAKASLPEHVREFDEFSLRLPLYDFEEKTRPAFESAIDARAIRSANKKAAQAEARLKEMISVGQAFPRVDVESIKTAVSSSLRDKFRKETTELKRREEQPWGYGLDRVVRSEKWDEFLPKRESIPQIIKRKIGSFIHEELPQPEVVEKPLSEVRSAIPENIASPEFKLVGNLEAAPSVHDLDEVEVRKNFAKLQQAVESAIPLLVDASVRNPNITVLDEAGGKWQKIVFKNPGENRTITIIYDHRGGKTDLIFLRSYTHPIGKARIEKVGEPALSFALDLRGKEIRIISDYEADPNREYSTEDITMALSQFAIGERTAPNTVPMSRIQVAQQRRSGNVRGTARRWVYTSDGVKVGDEVHTVIRSEYQPLGQGDSPINLPFMLGEYTSYMEAVLPKIAVGEAVKVDVDLFGTPGWRGTLPLLAEISYWRKDSDNNPVIEHDSVHLFQDTGRHAHALLGESQLRKEGRYKGERLRDFVRQINQFENLARETNSVEMAFELGQFVNTQDNVALKDPHELMERLRGSQTGRDVNDKLVEFLNAWYNLTGTYEALARKSGQIVDPELKREFLRLDRHPLVGGIKRNVAILTQSKDEVERMMTGIPKEYRYLVDEKRIGVLKMMDSMDGKIQNADFGYPHLEQVNWYNYHHPNQGMGLPFPNEDGSLSPYQQQMMESVNWIRRLANEINPADILDFPRVEEKVNYRVKDEFLRENDPDWTKTVHDVGILLEKLAPDNQFALGFTLTDENYRQLDTPRKKLAAFLLLRKRLSHLVESVIGSFGFKLKDIGEYGDFADVIRIAEKQNVLRELDKNLIYSRMGDRTFIEWFNSIYHDPLFTSTAEVFMQGRNKVRDRFIEKAETILTSKSKVKAK